MLNNLALVLNLLNRAIIKLFESALDLNDYIVRLSSFWFSQTSKTVSKNALLGV